MDRLHLVHKHHSKSTGQARNDIDKLCKDPSVQQSYQEQLQNSMTKHHESHDPNEALNDLLDCMKSSAAKTVGEIKKGKRTQHTADPIVAQLSEQPKALRLKIYKHGKSEDRTPLRKERNNILRLITKRLKEVAVEEADVMADEITSTDDCRKMFRAAKQLRSIKPTPPIIVQDTDGNLMGTDEGKARVIKDWFQQQFTDQQDEPLQPFEGTPRPLQTPITEEEVKTAITALQNGRATGTDGVNSELFKHSKNIVSRPLAKTINSSFEHHTPIETLGEGILITLPKPKKPPGPPANIRPIALLNSIRKILSIITLRRIRDKIDCFTGPYQSGFKRGRSCADIVWAQRMLTSVVMTRKWDFHKMSIDMLRAFDTIKRQRILDVLLQAGCNDDELRLVRSLLAGTKLRVRVKNELSDSFETTIDSPQGDSLSPVLFTCYLAAALSSVRESSNRPNPPVSNLGLPLEMEYADDVDFPDEEKKPLDQLQPVAAEKLKTDNLLMNETKTEFSHVYLAEVAELDPQGKALRGNESWRKNKTMGSLLCSTTDVTARQCCFPFIT